MTNTNRTWITYRWNDNNDVDYIITDGLYDFGDWLNDNGVTHEQDGDVYYVLDDCGKRTGETYTVISEEPTDDDLCG